MTRAALTTLAAAAVLAVTLTACTPADRGPIASPTADTATSAPADAHAPNENVTLDPGLATPIAFDLTSVTLPPQAIDRWGPDLAAQAVPFAQEALGVFLTTTGPLDPDADPTPEDYEPARAYLHPQAWDELMTAVADADERRVGGLIPSTFDDGTEHGLLWNDNTDEVMIDADMTILAYTPAGDPTVTWGEESAPGAGDEYLIVTFPIHRDFTGWMGGEPVRVNVLREQSLYLYVHDGAWTVYSWHTLEDLA